MEPLGLALAVLPAFSVCLEYFQLYKTAKATSFDSQILLFKFDCEHENFIIWGEKHGVLKPSGDQDRNPELDSPDKAEKISKALELIQTLLSDAKALRDTYGVTTTTSPSDAPPQDRQDEPYPSNSGLKRLKWLSKRLGPGKQGPSLIERTRWAINDKNKFGSLIDDIRDLVERLYKILPVAEEERNHMAIRDIRSLAGNPERLKFYEEASLESHPVWSGAASVMLEAAGSTRIGPDNISQWMEKVEEDSDSADEVGDSKPADGKDDTLGLDIEGWYNYECYFVFTSTCLTSALGLSCDMDRLEVRSDGPSHVFDNDNRRIWGLGSRFKKLIVPKMPLIDFERISDAPYEVQGHLDTFLESHYPLARVKILCPPCRCAVRTALLVCSQQSSKKVEYKVGIDDRMPVSCCPEAEKLQRLRSLFNTLRELDEGLMGDETVPLRKDLLQHLDRPSLEHRIYRLETELYDNEHYRPPPQQVAELLSETRNADGIPIYLGEASRCAWIVQKAPFPWSPRVPKESEIFKFSRDYGKANFTTTYLGTFTSSSQLTRAVVPTPRSHGRRKGPQSLVSSSGAINAQPAQQGHQFGSSPDADNLDHWDLTKGEQELHESSESAGSGHMDYLDEPNRARNESERATKRFRLS